MAVEFTASASRQTFFSKPSNTTANTIYTATNVKTSTLESLNIACTGACNITVWIGNGTDYLLLDAFPVAANTSELGDFGNPVLLDGWTVKVMTSNADDATFTLTMAEESRHQN